MTNQDDAAVAFAGALGLWLFGAYAQLLARRGDKLEPVALETEDVNLVGLDLVHLGRGLGIDKGGFGEGDALALGLGLLHRAVVAQGALAPATAPRALGGAGVLEGGREHGGDRWMVVGVGRRRIAGMGWLGWVRGVVAMSKAA